MKNKKRQKWLDILKGIAILFIIIGHGPLTENGILFKFLWSFHLPLFFLISGYTFTPKDEKELIKNKFKRLMIPYYFTCIMLIIFNIIHDAFIQKITLKGIYIISKYWIWAGIYGSCWSYTTPFKINSIGAIWFLCTLFVSLILFNYVINKDEKYHNICIMILLYIGMQLTNFMWLPFNFASACVCTLFLYVGYLAKKHDILNNKSLVLNIILFILAFTCIMNKSMVIVGNNTYTYGLYSLFGGISISYFIARSTKIIEKIPIINNFLSYIGKNTLPILCFHLIEIDFIPWKDIIILKNSYINIIIILAIQIFSLLLIVQIIKKTPLKKIFY